jgi:hypothetical protein
MPIGAVGRFLSGHPVDRRGERFDCGGPSVLARGFVFLALRDQRPSFVRNFGNGVGPTPPVSLHALLGGTAQWAFPTTDVARYSHPMARRQSPTDQMPAPFVAARDEGAAPRAAPLVTSTVLPLDLPAALARLPESDLSRLEEALSLELRRRNLVATPVALSAAEPEKPKFRRRAIEPISRDASDGPPLTAGKVNAIRAAVKAGVKPTAIARQFGVSLTAIKHALENKR